jgi:hypothetical protein
MELNMAQQDHYRHIRLLAQYAADRIGDLLEQNDPPRGIYDMTTWRLERPDNLLEVVEGVLADLGLREKWPTWKVFKKTLDEIAMPAWVRGQEAYQHASTGGLEYNNLRRLMDDDPADFGMRVALNTEKGQSSQMWFYEGWLTALNEKDQKGIEDEPSRSQEK